MSVQASVSPRVRTLHFVVLEHGLGGRHSSLEHLSGCIRNAFEAKKRRNDGHEEEVIVLNHAGNDGWKSYVPGIVGCASRLRAFVLSSVRHVVQDRQARWYSRIACDANAVSPDCTPPLWRMCFHCIGFSMGGLVIRAALPRLQKAMRETFHQGMEGRGGSQYQHEVQWKTFLTLSSPHLGCRVPHPSMKGRYSLAGLLHPLPIFITSFADLMCLNNVMERLLQPRYLEALRLFDRRVLLGALGDRVVWNYSSCFFLPMTERFLLQRWRPAGPLELLYMEKHQLCHHAVRPPPTSVNGSRESSRHSVFSVCVQAEQGDGESGQKDNTDAAGKRERTRVTETETPHAMIPRSVRRLSCIPWVGFSECEERVLADTALLLSQAGIRPARNLEDLNSNKIILLQPPPSASCYKRRMKSAAHCETKKSSPTSAQPASFPGWINPLTWPREYLEKEREMGLRFLSGAGPVELHVVDFVGATEDYLDEWLEARHESDGEDTHYAFSSSIAKRLLRRAYYCAHSMMIGADNESASDEEEEGVEEGAVRPPQGGSSTAGRGKNLDNDSSVASPHKRQVVESSANTMYSSPSTARSRPADSLGFVSHFVAATVLS